MQFMRFFVLVFCLLSGCGAGSDRFVPSVTGGAGTTSVTSATPLIGPIGGGTPLTVFGSGFQSAPAATTVSVGSGAATDVVVVDDSTLTCLTPPGALGAAAITVTSGNGIATAPQPFLYVAAVLYAADGKSGVAGNLYTIDPTDGAETLIGEIGFAVAGMAISPAGLLFATEATKRNKLGDSRLLLINTNSGAGSVVGTLTDSTGAFVHGAIPDVTFFGDRLIGWSQDGDVPVEINTATGEVTIIGSTVSAFGSGIAADANNAVYLAPEGSNGSLYLVNPETDMATAVASLSGGGIPLSAINALAFHFGELFALENDSNGSPTSDTALLRIDPITGVMTQVRLPQSSGLSALASNSR